MSENLQDGVSAQTIIWDGSLLTTTNFYLLLKLKLMLLNISNLSHKLPCYWIVGSEVAYGEIIRY